MSKKLFFILLSSPLFAFGQNLVPNPSFEDTVACPAPPSGSGLINDATGWLNCGLTPDYYNACANFTGPTNGVPYGSYSGYQYAFDGNAYAGFVTYTNPPTGHEFIGIQLLSPLVIGTKYYASAYISMSNIYLCASDNFGFRFFSAMPFSTSNPAPIDNFCPIYSNTIISDTANWTQIASSFIADSAYQYLVIGNFFDNSNTDTINCNPVNLSYYLIDAVCVSTDSLTCYVWTGLNSIEENPMIVFPNPADNILYIKNLYKNCSFSIINNMGMVIKTGEIAEQNKINILSIPDGIYFLEINNKHFYKFLIIHN